MPAPLIERVYPEHRFGGFTRHDGTIHFYSRVKALLERDQVVLDLGCGRGQHRDDRSPYRRALRTLKSDEWRVIGIDIDEAGRDNPYLDEFRRIEDPDRWPVEDASIDVVVADFVLEHVANPAAFFGELARVLKPGGYFCARTPNAYSYVGLLARLMPNRFHARITAVAQENRQSIDVFPTVYACNSKRRLRRYLETNGFEPVIYRIEPEPAYLAFSGLAYRIGAVLHRLLPPPLRSTLLVYAQRAGGVGR